MLASALRDQLGVRPRALGQRELPTRAGEVERRAVLAREEVVEVARRQEEAAVPLLHVHSLADGNLMPTARCNEWC